MATAITNIQTVLNTGTLSTATAATATVADATEVFTFTPTKSKYVIQINNVSASDGSVTYSIAKGTHWAATVPLTGTILQGTSQVIELDTARVKGALGVISLTLTPASGKILLTDHELTIQAIQLVD